MQCVNNVLKDCFVFNLRHFKWRCSHSDERHDKLHSFITTLFSTVCCTFSYLLTFYIFSIVIPYGYTHTLDTLNTVVSQSKHEVQLAAPNMHFTLYLAYVYTVSTSSGSKHLSRFAVPFVIKLSTNHVGLYVSVKCIKSTDQQNSHDIIRTYVRISR